MPRLAGGDRLKNSVPMRRRDFITASGAIAVNLADVQQSAARTGWRPGPVTHILPAASDNGLQIKASLHSAPIHSPTLTVRSAGRRARQTVGTPTSGDGRYWRFDVPDLTADRPYRLQINSPGAGQTDPWTIRTLPAPGSTPQSFRLLTYTCAGGDEASGAGARRSFNPIQVRQALLERALSFRPDAVIANGDHVYWDQETAFSRPTGAAIREYYRNKTGLFDLGVAAASQANTDVLSKVGDAQIAELYGVAFRSTPMWFVRDDHDYFDNDQVIDGVPTFPPTPFRKALTDQLQAMFWPDLLGAVPPGPSGTGSFGSLRWGRLFEALLYDCRGYLSLTSGGFVPDEIEQWIVERTRDPHVTHVMQTPSTPWGWTAGKWGEWYPDVSGADGRLTVNIPKPGWRPGWLEQHQRLLAVAGSRGRPSLVMSGDLHAVGSGRLLRSGDVTPASPVYVVLSGPIGTDDLSFPSAARAQPPAHPAGVVVSDLLSPREKNGFTIVDATKRGLRVRQFMWRAPDSVEAIASLEPAVDLFIPTDRHAAVVEL